MRKILIALNAISLILILIMAFISPITIIGGADGLTGFEISSTFLISAIFIVMTLILNLNWLIKR